VGAQVALTPMMAPPPGSIGRERCTGLQVPRQSPLSAPHGLGALVTVTTDKLNVEQALHTIMSHNDALQLRMVLVTVDFKEKTDTEEAALTRRKWAASSALPLKQIAESVRNVSGADVLVELVDMRDSCMGRHLSRVAFRDYAGSGCGVRGAPCNTSRFWKNTVAFSWALSRMATCVQYVVHLDNDIRLSRSRVHPPTQQLGTAAPLQQSLPSRSVRSWVRRAVSVLQANQTLLSVHPLRGPGPSCAAQRRYGASSDGPANWTWCACQRKRDPASGGLHNTRSTVLPASADSQPACLLTYEGPHKPGVPHFSIQAFVMDVQRFQRVWPLTPYRYASYGPYRRDASPTDAKRADFLRHLELKRGIRRHEGRVDPESIFEENAMAAGLDIVYMAAADLGVEKQIVRG
jgi:hypothetical protein